MAAPTAPTAPPPTASADERAARWEARLRPFVLAAALAVIPLVALSLAHPEGLSHDLEVLGHWVVWLVFAVEIVIMLVVVYVATDHSLLQGAEHVAALLALGALGVFAADHLRRRSLGSAA